MKRFSMWNTLITTLLLVYMSVHVFVKKMPTIVHGVVISCFSIVYLVLWGVHFELCPPKWTFGHTKTDTYRFKEQFHRFEKVMPETRYVDDVSH